MLNFTPPIKASLLTTLVYLLSFQFFMHQGNVAWLIPANIFFVITSVLYIRFLSKNHPSFDLPALTAKGSRLSCMSSVMCFGGALCIFLINHLLFSGNKNGGLFLKDIKGTVTLIFANGLLVNFVSGCLAAFITAGFVNEKKYTVESKPLPSVK